MPLSDFLNIQISTQTPGPTQPGFGMPLVLGTVNGWGASSDKVRFYQQSSYATAMVADGIATTDPEYLAATAIFSQNPAPPTIAVGRRTNKPTQQFKVTVLQAVNGKTYTVTVNGVAKSFTAGGGDTTSTIATGLAAAIGSPAGFGAASAAVAVVTFTASAAGNWARVAPTNPNVDLDCWQSHADAGVQADLTAIANVDSSWYDILTTFGGSLGATNTSELGQIAAWAEANGKLFTGDVQDTTILGSGTTDIASNLKTLSYVRSPLMFHPDNGAFAAAAWAGSRLPYSPGSETWKFATLAGVPTTTFTATQVTNMTSKRCNYYYSVGSPMTAEGITPSGQYIDTVRGRDALQADLQANIFRVLQNPPSAANPANPLGSVLLAKVPFTDAGIAVVESEVRASLRRFVNSGFLAASPEPSVSVPKASAVSAASKAARNLSPVSFSATIAGAIHAVTITGGVSF